MESQKHLLKRHRFIRSAGAPGAGLGTANPVAQPSSFSEHNFSLRGGRRTYSLGSCQGVLLGRWVSSGLKICPGQHPAVSTRLLTHLLAGPGVPGVSQDSSLMHHPHGEVTAILLKGYFGVLMLVACSQSPCKLLPQA